MRTGTPKGTIVIADDEPNLRLVLERLLREEGYTVHSATDGVEALSLARSVRPDLLVLDIMMPNLDGPGVAAALRDDPGTAHVPIVFLTAVLTHDDQARLSQRRTDQVYLAKPYDVDELLATVRHMLASATLGAGTREDTP
ncbi:MAG TPA: response regulator [Phycisphaerales bacterium]|nr:response regulator [Phycisphaerales bacterium]